MSKPEYDIDTSDIGVGLGFFILFMCGIIVFLLGYILLMFISMFDIMTFGLFDWTWLWWHI
jgi:hypothetical protein